MKLINIKTFAIICNILESKLTAYNHKKLSILKDTEGVEIPKTYFIDKLKNIGKNGKFKIVEIIKKCKNECDTITQERKNNKQKQDLIKTFKGHKFKITADLCIADPTHRYHNLFSYGLIENKDRKTVNSRSNMTIPKFVVSYWDVITDKYLTLFNNPTIYVIDGDETSGRIFTIETNPLYDADNVERC